MFTFVFWTFGFLRTSTTGLIAQAFGANDAAALSLSLWRALALAITLGVVIVIFQGPLIHQGTRLLTEDAGVLAQANLYCVARVWCAPFSLANYAVLGYLLGMQRVRAALALQIIINVANVLAAVVLVYALSMGIAGIGAATALADAVGFVSGIGILWREGALARIPRLENLLETRALMRLLSLNVNLLGRTLCLLAVFAWFTRASGQISVAVLAANTVLLNFQTFMAYGLDGFAQACETLVGAAIGAADRLALKRWIKASTALAALVALGFVIVYWCFGARVIELLTDLPSVRAKAQAYLPFAALSPIISVWAFQLDGVFIGATRARDLLLAMILSSSSFALALVFLAPYGNVGLWLAFLTFMAARALCLAGFLPRLVRSVANPPATAA
jgi:MATE family multidrug resistance protein